PCERGSRPWRRRFERTAYRPRSCGRPAWWAAAARPGWSCPRGAWASTPRWRRRCAPGTRRSWAGSSVISSSSTCGAWRPRTTTRYGPPSLPPRRREVYVVATAGHVDHGKSTLIQALTGMQPDRWAEERRRGLTIDLGFAWTDLPSGATVAFVDVPGHERFVPNMLAGIGAVPAALFVVAADEGWMPQSAEHLAALDALDVRHAVLAVTRADLADPAPAAAQARAELARTALGEVEAVAVSAPHGRGLDDLTAALDRLLLRLPAPDADAPV